MRQTEWFHSLLKPSATTVMSISCLPIADVLTALFNALKIEVSINKCNTISKAIGRKRKSTVEGLATWSELIIVDIRVSQTWERHHGCSWERGPGLSFCVCRLIWCHLVGSSSTTPREVAHPSTKKQAGEGEEHYCLRLIFFFAKSDLAFKLMKVCPFLKMQYILRVFSLTATFIS